MNEIIKGVELLYVILRKVDMEKHLYMPYLRHILHTTKDKVKKAFADDFKADQYLQIIDYRTEIHMDQDIHNEDKFILRVTYNINFNIQKNFTNEIICLTAYYLYPTIQFRYNLGTRSDLMSA